MKFNGLVIGGLLIWGLSGCGGNPRESGGLTPKSPNFQPIKPPAQGPSTVNLSTERGSEPRERPFNPEGTPDPFQPPAEELSGGIKRKVGVLPLEQFEVGDYQLVGIISGPGLKKAVIQDLTGKGFFVGIGTRIGKGGGKISKITQKEVFIDETYLDVVGRKKNRRIALKIPDPLL
jgi:type IV pilus assembly protein PilP